MIFSAPRHRVVALALAALGTVGSAGLASPASAAESHRGPAVFVQSDNVAGNTVVAYDRNADGTLSPAGSYPTGGLGGVLTARSSTTSPRRARSRWTGRTTAVRRQRGQRLGHRVRCRRRPAHPPRQWSPRAVPSRSAWPSTATWSTSSTPATAARSRASGGVGERAGPDRRLTPRARSRRLRARPSSPTPPARSPSPRTAAQLVVTTKANGSDVDVFAVDRRRLAECKPDGEPSARRRALRRQLGRGWTPGARRGGHRTPWPPSASTRDGVLHPVDTAATGQAATCWIVRSRRPVLRLERRQRRPLGLPDRPRRQPHLAGHDRDRPRHGRRHRHPRRPLPLRSGRAGRAAWTRSESRPAGR